LMKRMRLFSFRRRVWCAGNLEVELRHIYCHLNSLWNCRYTDLKLWHEYYRELAALWNLYPKGFLEECTVEGHEPIYLNPQKKINRPLISMYIQRAKTAVDFLDDRITELENGGTDLLTEPELKALLLKIYRNLNSAWHIRYVKIKDFRKYENELRNYWEQFPWGLDRNIHYEITHHLYKEATCEIFTPRLYEVQWGDFEEHYREKMNSADD